VQQADVQVPNPKPLAQDANISRSPLQLVQSFLQSAIQIFSQKSPKQVTSNAEARIIVHSHTDFFVVFGILEIFRILLVDFDFEFEFDEERTGRVVGTCSRSHLERVPGIMCGECDGVCVQKSYIFKKYDYVSIDCQPYDVCNRGSDAE
jgi:hypothetical protein